jgi:pilus assembly protein CpaE
MLSSPAADRERKRVFDLRCTVRCGNSRIRSCDYPMSSPIQISADQSDAVMSIAIISPDRQRRIAAASNFAQCGIVHTREFDDYPASLDDVPHLLQWGFDVILIDLDGNREFALELVEALCSARSTIVMVFSAQADPDLMLRSMRAGAREFFTLPFNQGDIAKALLWASVHRQTAPVAKKADGRLLVFFGSKGGVGVTTLASNFAVALAEESRQSTVLIDLNLYLGDAAVNLGIDAQYSVLDALQNSTRLDPPMLLRLLAHHSSGLSVLAAPAELPAAKATDIAIGCLLAVARQQFHYVVVDAGKKIDLHQMHLFEESATAYLVTQVGIPELRNANRLISQFTVDHCPKLEIVVNRNQSRFLGLTNEHLNKAHTRPIQWKIPNDFKAVCRMQSSGTPIVHQDSPIASVIRQMARSACGLLDSVASQTGHNAPPGGFRLPWKGAAKTLNPEISSAEAHLSQRRAAHSFLET